MPEQPPSPFASLPPSAKYGLLLFVALPCLPGLIFLLAGVVTDPHRLPHDPSPTGGIGYAQRWERTRSLYLAGAVVLMGGTLLSAGVVWKLVQAAKAAQATKELPVPVTPPGDYETVLRSEFKAEEGSFLIQLRCGLKWDKEAFSQLITAMEAYAAANEEATTLPKWIAEGFWYLSFFVKDWSSHPNFPKGYPSEYYEAAYERLYDLSFWLFEGKSPSQKLLPPM